MIYFLVADFRVLSGNEKLELYKEKEVCFMLICINSKNMIIVVNIVKFFFF